MSILYHQVKVNVVANTLSRLSMGSNTHVSEEKRELAKDVHKLAPGSHTHGFHRRMDSGDKMG